MISLFDYASNDQSVYYLSQIFGYMESVLATSKGSMLLGTLFQVINTTALTVGSFIVIYTTVVGLLNTAQEGEFMGRKWNSLWVPVRTVFGISMLYPMASGYSVIQVIFMWVILQGVGAADTVWTTGLNYINFAGSSDSTISTTASSTSVKSNMQTLFNSLVCQATARAEKNSDADYSFKHVDKAYYFCDANPDQAFCADSNTHANMLDPIMGSQVSKNTYKMGPSGDCGSITYCDLNTSGEATSLAYKSCEAQQEALKQIVLTLGDVAEDFVVADNQYIGFYTHPVPAAEGGKEYQVQWIKDFCQAQKPVVSNTDCCVQRLVSKSQVKARGSAADRAALAKYQDGDMMPVYCPDNTPTESSEYGGAPFTPINAGDDQNDYTNPPESTVTTFYKPYPITDEYGDQIDFIGAAVDLYNAANRAALTSYLSSVDAAKDLDGWMKDAQKQGWIYAGAYYYSLATKDKKDTDSSTPKFEAAKMDSGKFKSLSKNYRNNNTAAQNLLDAIAGKGEEASSTASVPGYDDATSQAKDSVSILLGMWMGLMTEDDGSALKSIAGFGYGMMIAAQALFAILLVTFSALALASGLGSITALGFGVPGFGTAVQAILAFISPAAWLMIGALYSLGATLGIYVPLIPYVIFITGAIGWFIACIEAIVAAPFVALGILSPGGQHEVLGKAEQSVMMLFNLFLRPGLMVFGLLAAMLLSEVVIKLINATFVQVSTSIMANPGLFESIVFIAAYTSLIVVALNKTFSLIYHIPERVLTWIGGHAVQYGEAQDLGQVKQATEGAASAVGKNMQESGGAAQKAGSTIAEQKQKDKNRGQGGGGLQ